MNTDHLTDQGKSMKITDRFNGETIYEADVGTMRECVESAVRNGVSLRNANLRNVNLHNADVCGGDLRGADLCGADLRNVNFGGADLRGANLHRANLCGADMSDADLCGAYMAYGWVLDGRWHHVVNIGSNSGTLELYSCGEQGWVVRRGCFQGSLSEFLMAVANRHGDNEHGRQYRAVISALTGEAA